MTFGVPINELLWLAAAILAGGVVTGIMAGLFGIGGGGIIVPVLYEVFRALDVPEQVRMQLCIGTSLAIILPTTIRSYRAHLAKGAVLQGVVRAWALPAVFGVAAGAALAAFAPASAFKIFFAVVATIIATKLLVGRASWKLGDELPGRALMSVYGVLVGLTSSLMGVSGGSISAMFLSLYNKPIHNIVATSAGIGVPITIAGTIGYMLAGWPQQALMPPLSIGFVSLLGVALMAPVSSFTAGYGARLAHRMPRRRLEIAFGIFLLLVSARFVISI
jgi:uncharacterized membrane protein YfcA